MLPVCCWDYLNMYLGDAAEKSAAFAYDIMEYIRLVC